MTAALEGLNFGLGRDDRCGVLKWVFKELIFFAKVRASKRTESFNILRAYELKFEPNLGCRPENFSNFGQNSIPEVEFVISAQNGL